MAIFINHFLNTYFFGAVESIDDQPFDPQTITRQDQRRMSNCLQAAGWERAGKHSSGSKRNQVRFVRPTIASDPYKF